MNDPIPMFPSEAEPRPPAPWLEEMPPRQIVAELDRYIVGQEAAKRAVAIAIRNRWRRAQTSDEIRDEITPHNIILIGPTGVGNIWLACALGHKACRDTAAPGPARGRSESWFSSSAASSFAADAAPLIFSFGSAWSERCTTKSFCASPPLVRSTA